MRKRDEMISTAFGKAAKTISFDKIVLKELESKAKREGTTSSKIVNMLCKQEILTDARFFRLMAKEHYLKFQEYKYMCEETAITIKE